jgi:Phage integrase, N-terminal SAM-like domain
MPRSGVSPPRRTIRSCSPRGLYLRAEHKTPQTIKAYRDGVRAFLRWCAEQDRPAVLDRPTVNEFVVALLDSGAEPATARRLRSLLGHRASSARFASTRTTGHGERQAAPA